MPLARACRLPARPQGRELLRVAAARVAGERQAALLQGLGARPRRPSHRCLAACYFFTQGHFQKAQKALFVLAAIESYEVGIIQPTQGFKCSL